MKKSGTRRKNHEGCLKQMRARSRVIGEEKRAQRVYTYNYI